jgi:isocitrate dehydrogenase (NAD+)
MLHHIAEDDMAVRVKRALVSALADGSARTADLGGTATTTQFTDAIVKNLEGK